jgi:hypothetical protein
MARPKGEAWLTFAGVVMILSGVLGILNGLTALSIDNETLAGLVSDNIHVWGTTYIVYGIVMVCAGVAVFAGASWAVWTGIVVSLVGAAINMLWVFDQPIIALIMVSLHVLVLYGLVLYGLGDEQTA